jgi:hypothetical protein
MHGNGCQVPTQEFYCTALQTILSYAECWQKNIHKFNGVTSSFVKVTATSRFQDGGGRHLGVLKMTLLTLFASKTVSLNSSGQSFI